MYNQEEDPYGEEMDGEDERNDGLNALVNTHLADCLEFIMGHWIQ